jgi:hypothetical protein
MKKIFLIVFALAFSSAMNVTAAVDAFTATLYAPIMSETAQISLEGRDDTSATFSIGEEAIMFVRFEEAVRFAGGARLATNIPVIGYLDARSAGAWFSHILLDGEDFSPGATVSMRPGEDGFLAMHFDIMPAKSFTTLEIQFAVNNLPTGVESDFEAYEVRTYPVIIPMDEPEGEASSYMYQIATAYDEASAWRTMIVAVAAAVAAAIAVSVILSRKKK